MMCQTSGRPPTSTIGLGRNSVSSHIRVPCPPHRMTTLGVGHAMATELSQSRSSFGARMPMWWDIAPFPRVLVTGASGFVGAAVVRLAVERVLAVTALAGPRSRLDRLAPVARDVEIVRADITDQAALAAA